MGDRYLLCRIAPVEDQFERALEHTGEAAERMRRELAEVVNRLFAVRRTQPRPLDLEERDRIGHIVSRVVRMRSAVDRDRYTREIEVVHGTEGTARIGLSLERLLAGLDTLGVDRVTALSIIEAVAMDSTPPMRRRAYEYLKHIGPLGAELSDVAVSLGLPAKTLQRHLEDLAVTGVVKRIPADKRAEFDLDDGKADVWQVQ